MTDWLTDWLIQWLIQWFSDSVIDFFARAKFFELTKEACQESFRVNIDKVLPHLAVGGKVNEESVRGLLFGDYVDSERLYDEVTDIPELIKTMET